MPESSKTHSTAILGLWLNNIIGSVEKSSTSWNTEPRVFLVRSDPAILVSWYLVCLCIIGYAVCAYRFVSGAQLKLELFIFS